MKKSVLSPVFVGTSLALALVFSSPVSAGRANPAMVKDFETQALDAAGCFRLVHCAHGQMVDRGDVVKESYRCEFVDDDFWGTPVLPDHAMTWDYESTKDITGEGCDVPLAGPFRSFSDVLDILSGDTQCWMYTNESGEDIGDSSIRARITPSGNVNVTVVYDPPVFEGPECP